MTTALSPRQAYDDALARLEFTPDEAQSQAVDMLESCFQALHGTQQARGVYLWGPVGRGKTWLMDRFFEGLGVPARRQHFHHFMRWVHQRQFKLMGTPDPLSVMACELRDEVRVLCLDELFVSDVADAMLLGRLLQVMFAQGVVMVTTSNQPPHALYQGYNRECFTPAIEAMERYLQVVQVDGGCDHREHPGAPFKRYWVTQPGQTSALPRVFEALCGDEPSHSTPIDLGHCRIQVERRSDQVLWCRFEALCEQPLAALDFIGLCDRFTHILVSEVPALGGSAQGAELGETRIEDVGPDTLGGGTRQGFTRQDDGARRFIALVDECYDRHVPLYIEAAVPLDQLYHQGDLAFPFRRAVSRLKEMQLKRFGQARRA